MEWTQSVPDETATGPDAGPTLPTSEPTPVWISGTPPASGYSVFWIEEGVGLPAHELPDLLSPVTANLSSEDAGLLSTGRRVKSLLLEWVELHLPGGGAGWVDRYHLTETVTSDAVCADPQVAALVENLRAAVETRNGSLMEAIVSPPHGLSLTLLHGGNTRIYRQSEVFGLFADADVVNWGFAPASGLPVIGSFGETVLPDLWAVLSSPFEPYCDSIHLGGASYSVDWPYAWRAAHHLSLFRPAYSEGGLDWMTWVIGVEYVDGFPMLFSLSRYAWEP